MLSTSTKYISNLKFLKCKCNYYKNKIQNFNIEWLKIQSISVWCNEKTKNNIITNILVYKLGT